MVKMCRSFWWTKSFVHLRFKNC